MSIRAAWRIGAIAALMALTLSGCANNIQRSAKLECARLRHLEALKAARVDHNVEVAACKAA